MSKITAAYRAEAQAAGYFKGIVDYIAAKTPEARQLLLERAHCDYQATLQATSDAQKDFCDAYEFQRAGLAHLSK